MVISKNAIQGLKMGVRTLKTHATIKIKREN